MFPRVPSCQFAREWTLEELRTLIEEHQTGADFDHLIHIFRSSVEEIWHELIYRYFNECCVLRDVSAPRHGMRWTQDGLDRVLE